MKEIKERIDKLIHQLKLRKMDYYLLSTSDEFLNEYPPDYNMRLKWLTNFSGSNGIALISRSNKYFFTDGRYLLQSKKQLIKDFKIFDSAKINIFGFILNYLKKKQIMLDMRCFSTNFVKTLISKANENRNVIVNDNKKLFDNLWTDRPKELNKRFFMLEERFTGESFNQKVNQIRPKDKSILVISSPESVCWLLNIRGYDVENTPLIFSRLILTKQKIELFVNKNKVPNEFINKYKKVLIFDINKFETTISKYLNKNILVDKGISYFFYDLLNNNNNVKLIDDPCIKRKSLKNSVEIKCSKQAHLKDGIALVKFFKWLGENYLKKKVTEFLAAKILEDFRKENKDFFSPSFGTISASGPNASIIHYQPEPNSPVIKKDNLYLCDSGGQYYGGTTDVTRTVFLGKKKPSNIIKELYTKVLIGHINIATLKFPIGTKGFQIDSLARYNLWNCGLDYNHGTGHGVGSFLGVHEGPQSISKNMNNTVLEPGMILSNEPGYYKDKMFGIRIENLVLVKKSSFKDFLEFETLSLFPYDLNLIKSEMLNNEQKKFVNSYHSKVYKSLSPFLKKNYNLWLKKKTKLI